MKLHADVPWTIRSLVKRGTVLNMRKHGISSDRFTLKLDSPIDGILAVENLTAIPHQNRGCLGAGVAHSACGIVEPEANGHDEGSTPQYVEHRAQLCGD